MLFASVRFSSRTKRAPDATANIMNDHLRDAVFAFERYTTEIAGTPFHTANVHGLRNRALGVIAALMRQDFIFGMGARTRTEEGMRQAVMPEATHHEPSLMLAYSRWLLTSETWNNAMTSGAPLANPFLYERERRFLSVVLYALSHSYYPDHVDTVAARDAVLLIGQYVPLGDTVDDIKARFERGEFLDPLYRMFSEYSVGRFFSVW